MVFGQNQDFLNQQKEKLEKNLKRLEKEIGKSAKEVGKEYFTEFPNYGTGEEDNAQEVQVYSDKLSLNKNLGELIKKHKRALKRIKDGEYGKCLKCSQPISKERLEAFPEAEYCSEHAK